MKKVITIAIVLILMTFCITNVFASDTLTKEKLEQAIEKINNWEEMNGEISLDGDNIIISNEDKKTTIFYNLEGNPKFTSQIIYTKDMDLEKFEEKSGELLNGLFGFIIVGVDRGIPIENALFYGALNTLSIASELEKIYENDQFDAIQVATDIFEDGILKENQFFDVAIKKISSTESEYIVESTYEVKIDEDFSKLEKYNMQDIMPTNEILQDAIIGQETYANEIAEEKEKTQEMLNFIDSMANSENIGINEIPQTGKTFGNIEALWVTLIISVSALVLYTIYNRRIDGNK